jgi:organic radical activating enzyme
MDILPAPISKFPDRYQLNLSNLCNLACWSCDESRSSRIQDDKKRINISVYPLDTTDPLLALRETIIESYNHHDTILLGLLGGEPTINKKIISFLYELVELGLHQRTWLEVTTNCHTISKEFKKLLTDYKWGHLSLIASLDQVDEKISWTRYGADWGNAVKNLNFYKTVINYLQAHITISVFNSMYFPDIVQYFAGQDIKISYSILEYPAYMSPVHWDGDTAIFGDKASYDACGMGAVFAAYGSNVIPGSKQKLAEYIAPLQEIRPIKLIDVDPVLYQLIFN